LGLRFRSIGKQPVDGETGNSGAPCAHKLCCPRNGKRASPAICASIVLINCHCDAARHRGKAIGMLSARRPAEGGSPARRFAPTGEIVMRSPRGDGEERADASAGSSPGFRCRRSVPAVGRGGMSGMLSSRAARAAARGFAFPLCFPAALCCALLSCRAHAQEAVGAPIVVTASRSEQALGDALPSVTVITREDIETTQSRDLAELLGRQAGIEFARSGGQGAQTSLFLRGANSNQVLVLVDGVRLNSVLDGAANLGGIATDSIERIEIARGNLSSLYGSEAIGGVVQIFTRGGAHPGADALVEAGQGHTRDASLSATTMVADAILSASLGYRSQQAISAIDVAQVPFINPSLDGNWNRNGALRLEQHGATGDFSAWAWGNRNDTDWDDPFNSSPPTIPTSAATQIEHASLYGYGLSGAPRFGNSQIRLSASETHDNSVNVSNVPNDVSGSDNDNNQFFSHTRQIALQDTTTLAPGIDATAGWEHLDQYGASTSYDPSGNNQLTEFSRQVNSFWMGTNGRLGSQQWQLNVRHDRYSDFGSATTGLIGWGWWFDPSWKLTAQASTAFRAPSFNDLYYPLYGNPALQPERARSEELGLRWAQGSASASAALFRNRVSDLIQSLAPSYVATNVGHAAMDGAELQAAATMGSLRLGGSLSLDRPRDLDTGLPLVRRASYSARVSAGYVHGAWSASADLQRTGARNDYQILSGALVQLPAYDLARLALQYAVSSRLQLHLRMENLFNASYQLVDGYNTLPRMIIGGIEAKL